MVRPTPTRLRPVAMAIAIALAPAACSSDDSSSDSTASTSPITSTSTATSTNPTTGTSSAIDEHRQVVVDYTISEGAILGYTLDEACVAEIVGRLSADDVAALAESATDRSTDATDPQLSAEGNALGNEVISCAATNDNTALVEQAAQVVLDSPSGDSLDPDCVRTEFRRLDDEQLQQVVDGRDTGDDRQQAVGLVLLECLVVTDTTG